MASDYLLMCVECREYLHCGKVYSYGENEARVRPQFDGLMSVSTWSRHRRDEGFGLAIERFFIRHRNHELRFCPEGVDELLEKTGDEFKSLTMEDVDGYQFEEVDAEHELKLWRERLKTEK
jgi:hypothetical protein